jgi:putative endonuclease
MSDSGRNAEELAAIYLQNQGLALLARNYRCRYGEIDLIARDNKTLVFVEVRMRTSNRFGGAAASITPAKRKKLTRTAHCYLSEVGQTPACRFDALLISGTGNEVQWLQNIFDD